MVSGGSRKNMGNSGNPSNTKRNIIKIKQNMVPYSSYSLRSPVTLCSPNYLRSPYNFRFWCSHCLVSYTCSHCTRYPSLSLFRTEVWGPSTASQEVSPRHKILNGNHSKTKAVYMLAGMATEGVSFTMIVWRQRWSFTIQKSNIVKKPPPPEKSEKLWGLANFPYKIRTFLTSFVVKNKQ